MNIAAAAAKLNHTPSRIQCMCVCISSDHRSTQSTVHIHILLSIGFSIVRFFLHFDFFQRDCVAMGFSIQRGRGKESEIGPKIK